MTFFGNLSVFLKIFKVDGNKNCRIVTKTKGWAG